jgi:sRNA-binding carbon storage regulator CsrA
MLILTRRPGESLRIEPDAAVPTEADPFGWFADGPIRVFINGVRHSQVRIGIEAPLAFRILRDELPAQPRAAVPAAPLRKALARKVRIMRTLRKWSVEALAQAAGLPVMAIRSIESGAGLVELGELEMLAAAFGTSVVGLLLPPGRTAEERVLLALLDGEG